MKHTLLFKSLVSRLCCTVLLVCLGLLNTSAQGVSTPGLQSDIAKPSCNLSGPLEGSAHGPNIIVNIEVANSTLTPTLNYEFTSNSSGAVILEKSTVVYNKPKNTCTQRVTIKPGTGAGQFNLKLTVTTANGTSTCSKSVSVTQ